MANIEAVSSHMPSDQSESHDIVFFGLFRSPKGLGQIARSRLAALQTTGLRSARINIEGIDDYLHISGTEDVVNSDEIDNKAILFANPDIYSTLDMYTKRRFWRSKYRVGEWYWELPSLPAPWRGEASKLHEIWVASEFTRQSVAAVHTNVRIVAPAISVRLIDKLEAKRRLGLPEESFTVLTMFDLASYAARKNPLGAVQAFMDAFPLARSEQRATLVIKTHSSTVDNPTAREIRRLAALDERIVIMDSRTDQGAIDFVQSACDVFISPHRSEGFGLILAECMARGKPVIATGYSGNLEFMSAENSFLSPFRLVDVPIGAYPHAEKQVWADPDLDYFVDSLRLIYNNPALAQQRASLARENIESHFAPDVVGRAMAKAISEMGGS
ncbi:glycosyltransferase family 4 protein [Aminobacter sp. AP02]|uniref:glycosyltransferase family 4 protein n=1 Tax=Aminobacter sp. AP02 TaxID=2135737 RepID=UPI001304AEC4|nr:glycosyltransferase family 4 protein [Aminobacter sp. AP02]